MGENSKRDGYKNMRVKNFKKIVEYAVEQKGFYIDDRGRVGFSRTTHFTPEMKEYCGKTAPDDPRFKDWMLE